MSAAPPQTDGPRNTGIMLVLGLASAVLLAIVVIFGLLAFDVDLAGSGDDAPKSDRSGLVSSGLTVMDSSTENDATAVEVELTVQNTSDSSVEDHQVLVQCEDGGYVSAISPLPVLPPGADTTLRMQLIGTGEPACGDPEIAFSPIREDD